jgi:hypothetical protein
MLAEDENEERNIRFGLEIVREENEASEKIAATSRKINIP